MTAELTPNLQMAFPAGESRLETMPVELLQMTMKSVARGVALDAHTTKPLDPYKKRVSKLLNLCLVSKRLDAVARPLMFNKVLICRSTELILLLRALVENRGVGKYIRTLDLSTTFLRRDPDHGFLNIDILRGLDPDLDVILPEGSVTMTSRQENDLRVDLYLKVLEKAPNVTKLNTNSPSWAVRGLRDRQLSPFGIESIVAHKRTARPQASKARLPKTLRILTVQGRPGYEGLTEGLPRQISEFLHQDATDDSNLERLNWIFDDTTWFESLPGAQWASDGSGLRGHLASLTTLHLVMSACRFSDIAIVCDSFPSLKRLLIISNYANYFLNNRKTDEGDGLSPCKTRLCLTRSISKLQHLELLHLDLATVPRNISLLGADGGLDLSSLSKLSQVVVSFRLFLFNKKVTATGSKYYPSLFLPQSLEKLGIMVRGYRCEAGKDLKRFLKGLHTACKYDFPRLKKVQYQYATGSPRLQTVDPRCICVCARTSHEDYCTYDRDSGMLCAFLPWIPIEKFQALDEKFRQRGVELKKTATKGYVVTGRIITTVS